MVLSKGMKTLLQGSHSLIYSTVTGISLIVLALVWQSGVIGQIFSGNPSSAKALDCQVGAPINTCSTDRGSGHTYCKWTENGNVEGECSVEVCNNGGTPPDCSAPSQSFACQRDSSLCSSVNQQYCENMGLGSAIIWKHGGACDPNNGEHDTNGCIFLYDNVRSFTGPNCQEGAATPTPPSGEQTVQTCKGPMTVSFLTSQLQQANYPGPYDNIQAMIDAFNRAACPAGVTPTPVSGQLCFLCDNGSFRRAGQASDCNGAPACPSMASGTNACLSSTDITGQSCGAVPTATPTPTTVPGPTATPTPTLPPGVTVTPVPVTPTPGAAVVCAPGQVMTVSGSQVICLNVQQQQGQTQTATGGSSTSNSSATGGGGGSSTVNINSYNQERERVGFVAPSVVHVAGAAPSVQVQELPKTGLPLAGWLLSGFLPAGLGLKRFGKGSAKTSESANSLWQKREFDR